MATKRRKNPALQSEAIPDFPLSHWIDALTGERFDTITVRLTDREYLSVIAHDQDIRATGHTKRDAETRVLKVREGHLRSNPQSLKAAEEREDEKIAADYMRRKRAGKVGGITLEAYLKKHGEK